MPELKKEQLEAINHENGNMLVSASAGSGKTFVMIERLIRLIKEGKADLNEILAVTFTESAATDMKEKLKKALKKGAKENWRLANESAEVDVADISTLHSFCGKILRKYFYVTGIAPDFTVADETVASVIRQKSLNKTFAELYAKKEEWFLRLLDKFSYKRSDKRLKETVLDFYLFICGEAEPFAYAKSILNYYTPQGFEELLSTYTEYYNHIINRLLNELSQIIEAFARLECKVATDFCKKLYEDMQNTLCENEDIYKLKKFENYIIKNNFGKKISQEAIDVKKRAEDVKTEFLNSIKDFCTHITEKERDLQALIDSKEDVCGIIRITEIFNDVYLTEKKSENVLDFSDLEKFALKTLQNENVRQTIKNKYKYIFFDEYQDVNGVQEEIINRISSDNVFMVGDLKQSIYAFRGSRAEFFSQRLFNMQKKGEKTLKLNHNFRSANAVIDTVNNIFDYCMTENSCGIDYKTSRLISGGIYNEQAVGRATLHVIDKEPKKRGEGETARLYNILNELNFEKEEKNSDVANLINKIIEDELHKKYYSPKTGEFKRVTYGDIAILTRNRENGYVRSIVNGLSKHGVPIVSEISQNVCDFFEVRVLINLLKLIDCYTEDIPLAGTLKSPIGNFTDEQLSEIVLFYKDNCSSEKASADFCFFDAYSFYLENADTPLKAELMKFDLLIKEARFLADFCGAHDILEKLMNKSGYWAMLYAGRLGEQSVKRVRKFLSESICGNKKYTVKEFLNIIKNNPKAFDFSEVAEENTVKVMTMHASKGLEFPIVIVCGLEKSLNFGKSEELYYKNKKYGFALKSFNTQSRTLEENLLRGVVSQNRKEESVKEEMRLLYVAVTRATYSLHITLEGDDIKPSNEFFFAKRFSDYFPSGLPTLHYKSSDLEFYCAERQTTPVLISQTDENAMAEMKKNFAFTYDFSADCIIPLKSSVTANLCLQEQNGLEHYIFSDEDETDIERGNIAHKIMEYNDFEDSDCLKNKIDLLIKNRVITESEARKINAERLEKALQNDIFKNLKGKTLYREKSFFANIGADVLGFCGTKENVVVQGVIDLLATDEKSACIIDYKYSSLTEKSLKQKYYKQLQIYKTAVERVLKIPVTEMALVNLFTGDVVRIQ